MTLIRCRARIADECLNGRDELIVAVGFKMQDDGTWDGETIVCDPCYAALMPHTESGKALQEEIPAAIAKLRQERLLQGKEG